MVLHEGQRTTEEVLKETPVLETESTVFFSGVELPKAKDGSGNWVPRREKYEDYIYDDVSVELQRNFALAFSLNQPYLVEGGTEIGKTTAVMEMCSRLGYEVHYVNLNYGTDESKLMGKPMPNLQRQDLKDPEFVYWLGKISSGLMPEEGKVKVIVLDEIGAAQPGNIIILHEIFDQLERGGSVDLSEYGNGVVNIDPEKVKIVALTNPPGKGYQAVNVISPPLMRRFTYFKALSELPEKSVSSYISALFEKEEVLMEIPGIGEVIAKYKEFHRAAKEFLKNRTIADDQPQPFTYGDRTEPKRFRDFIAKRYRGDINETVRQALIFYYVNKLENQADKKQLEQLIPYIEYRPPVVESKRRVLEARGGAEAEKKRKLIDEIETLKSEIEDSGKLPEGFGVSETGRGENPIIKAKTEKGEPIEFNFEQIKSKVVDFYKKNNLEKLAGAVESATIFLTKEQKRAMVEMVEKEGFDSAWIFPGDEVMQANSVSIKQETKKEMPWLDKKHQYKEKDEKGKLVGTYLSSEVKSAFPDKIQNDKRPNKPYVMFYKSSREVDPEIRQPLIIDGKTVINSQENIEKNFKERKIVLQILNEYLILQRVETENNKDKGKPHPDTDFTTWLGSRLSGVFGGPRRGLRAHWVPGPQQVGVFSSAPGLSLSDVGARSSAIFEIL